MNFKSKSSFLNLRGISIFFPSQKKTVDELVYLSIEDRFALKTAGFDIFYYCNPDLGEDAISCALSSAKKLFIDFSDVKRDEIDLMICCISGNTRLLFDWSIEAYILSELQLRPDCLAFPFNTQCSSLSRAMGLVDLLMEKYPQIRNTLVVSGYHLGPPAVEKNAVVSRWQDKTNLILFGSGGASMLITRKPSEVTLINPNLGFSWTNGPAAYLTPIHMNEKIGFNGKNLFGGTGYLDYPPPPSSVKANEKGFLSTIFEKMAIDLGETLANKSIKTVEIGHIPLLQIFDLPKVLKNRFGISASINKSTLSKYGHVGPCDPAIFISEVIKNHQTKNNHAYCFFTLGQGISGSSLIATRC